MGRLVITADDLGYSSRRDDGILSCWESGAITRSSLMVNGISAESAAKKAKERGLVLGLHFNIIEGTPVCDDPSRIKSLLCDGVDANGKCSKVFLDKGRLSSEVDKGNIDMEEVRIEARAQILKFIELCGESPKYVDGHQHAHVLPGICNILGEEMQRYGISETRHAEEPGIEDCALFQDKTYLSMFIRLSKECRDAKKVWQKYGIRTPLFFFGNCTIGRPYGGDMTIKDLQERLLFTLNYAQQKDKNPTIELMTHPGFPLKEGEAGGCGTGPDAFAQSQDRQNEINILCSSEMKNFYDKLGLTLVSSTM